MFNKGRSILIIWTAVLFVIGLMLPAKASGEGVRTAEASRLLGEESTGVRFTVTVPVEELELEEIEENGKTYTRVGLPGWSQTAQAGAPSLPLVVEQVGAPLGAEVTLYVVPGQARVERLSAPVLPVVTQRAEMKPPVEGEPLLPEMVYVVEEDASVYGGGEYPGSLAVVMNDGMVRQQRVLGVVVYPVQYNAQRQELTVYETLEVEVRFSGGGFEGGEAEDSAAYESVLEGELLNYESAQGWRAVPLEAEGRMSPLGLTGAGVPWAPPEPGWRVKVRNDGFYRLSYAELVTAGLPVSSLDPRTIKMYNLGKELAIRVVGEGDGEFNSTDYIVFYGEGLDSKYTWDNIYWLTYGGDNGRRMGARDGSPGAGSTPGWHVSNLHIEENTYYFSNAPGSDDLERYVGAFLYPPYIPSWTKTFTLDAPASAAGQMTISMIGYLANAINPDHHVRVTLNGEQIGDVYWDGITWSNLSMPLRAGLLRAGENTLVVTAVDDTGVGSDMLYIDAVDVEYANTFTAVGDELWFKNGAAGVYRYRLNGFTTGQVEVYDVTDAENVEQISNLAVSGSNPYMVEFSDVAGGAGQYLAKAAGSYKAVQGIETVDTASNLRGVGNGADHIIITPRAFWEQAETLRAHRAGQGLRAVKVDLQDVYDEFNYGIASAEAIRDFLEYTYNAWVKPSPSYVVLMGDGHFDAKNYQNLGKVNYIPPYLAFVDPWLGETAADNRYVTFKDRMGNRDAMPDMMLGRMAVNSAAEAAAMVNKTIAYEANPAEPWQQQVLAVADNRDSGGLFDLLSDSLLAGHLPAPYTAEKVYLNVTHMTAADAKTAILAGINSGKLLVNYIGHASRTDWATEKLFGVADVKNLANGSKQPIILGMTCYDGYYQMPYLSDYFATAEVVTRGAKFDGAEDKGAVASWSPSGLGVASGHDRLNRGFFDALLTDGVETLGQATYAGKAELWASGTNYDLLETFLLFGDPALRVNRVPALKVSGNITTPSGGPFSGVEVSTTLANGQIRKATSNVDGKFLFNGLPRGEYVFTPLMTGYNFNPAASAPQVLDDSDLSGVNFTSSLAPIFSISGTVKDYQGQVLDDVTVSIDNGQAPVVTQSDGKYAFGELTLGTYQVSVSRAGYLFPVPSQSVTISGVSRTNINFSGLPLHSISGRITYNGAPLPGVTVDDALGHTALSGVDGTYLFEDLTPEVYTLTPSLEGYAFVPGSRQVTLSAVDVPGMNFSADKLGVNDPPLVLDMPDQQIVEGESFTAINLDDYVLDVDNPVEEIEWTFTGNTDLNVNITNRVATITLPHADWFGSEVITFRATDSDGLYGEDAVTFTVTPVNDAPVMVENIPDQWVIHGAAFAPIELDRYISDVDNSADEINWSVAGDTNLDVTIIDRVATITQREANWSGSETVTFRGTDPEGLFAEQPVNFDVVAVKPTVGQKLTAKRVTFEWSGITNANQYNVQLSLSDTFDKILLNATTSNLRFAYGSDLANGKTYYWRIRPRFGTTWGDWSTVKTSDQKPLEFLSMNPPLAPTLKAPAAGAFLRVKDVDFDWTDVVNADHYQLQISKTTAFKDPNTYYPQPGDQPFTVHDLPDGLYYWRIRAIDEVDVAGGWSATRSFTVDTIAPAAPALIAPLAGAYTYDTTPTLAVKAVPGATWYRYRVVTKAEGEPATCEQNVVLTSDKLNKTSWSTMTPELPYGDTYYWCAQAVDAAENESPWSESEARQITITLQNLPKPGTETMVRTPAFSWFAVPGALGYELELEPVAEDNNPTSQVYSVPLGPVTAYTLPAIKALDPGLYQWRVTAHTRAGQQVSPWRQLMIMPGVPSLSSLGNGAYTMSDTPTLAWTAVEGAAAYRIVVDNHSNFSSPEYTAVVGTTTHTLGTDVISMQPPGFNKLNDGRYYWKVQALDFRGNAISNAWSAVWSFIVDTIQPAPGLNLPQNGTTVPGTPTFSWKAAPGAKYYELWVDEADGDFSDPVYKKSMLTTLNHKPPIIMEGGYRWRVIASDLAGNESEGGEGWIVTVNPLKPVAPVLTGPANGVFLNDEKTEIVLSWNPVTAYAQRYEFRVDDDPRFTSPAYSESSGNETSYLLTDTAAHLLDNTKYYWQVRAVNSAGAETGAGAWSAARSFTVDRTPPVNPLLTLPANSGTVQGTPTFSWKAVPGAKYYELWVDEADGDFSDPVYKKSMLTTLNHKPPIIMEGGYRWRVIASDLAGNESEGGEGWIVTVNPLKPVAPVLTGPANGVFLNDEKTEIVLSWNPVTAYAQRYEFRVDDDPRFTSPAYSESSGNETSYLLTDTAAHLLDNTRYYWQVRAVNSAGAETGAGAWSAARSFTVDRTPPVNPLLTLPANSGTVQGTPTFSWKAVPGAKYYELWVDEADGDFSDPVYKKSMLTTLNHKPPIIMEGGYRWRVIASDLAGNESEGGEGWIVTVNPLKPVAPVLTGPANGVFLNDEKTEIVLSWNPVAYAQRYEFRVDDDPRFTSPAYSESSGNETSYLLTDTAAHLLDNTRYYWQVRAVNSAGAETGAGAWSAVRSFTVDRTPPVNAPGLRTPANEASMATYTPALSVNSLKDAKWYRFTVYQSGTCEANDGFISPDVTATSWAVPAAQALAYGKYHWCVQAVDAAGNASSWSEARVFTLTFQNQPGFAATTASATPGFSWYAVRGARGYRLEVKPVVEEGNTATREYSVYLGTVTSHVIPAIKALDPGAYQWRLRVYTAAGSEETPWRLLVVLPPAPVLDTPDNGSVHPGVTVELNWFPAAGAARYEIQADNNNNFRTPEIDYEFTEGPVTTKEVTFPFAGGFYWRVRAYNYLGNPGAWSAARYLRLTTP